MNISQLDKSRQSQNFHEELHRSNLEGIADRDFILDSNYNRFATQGAFPKNENILSQGQINSPPIGSDSYYGSLKSNHLLTLQERKDQPLLNDLFKSQEDRIQ
jgi:hypothetical protein